MKNWREGKHESRFPDGENFTELVSRAKHGLHEVLRTAGNCQDVAIVGHGVILLAGLPEICANSSDYDLRSKENCAISIFELKTEA
jgi:broad specificity phosphatase PhoE